MRTLLTAISLALRGGDFLKAESLIREIPISRRAFKRQKFRRPGCYIPAGPRANFRGTSVKNPTNASKMNAMHDRWHAARLA